MFAVAPLGLALAQGHDNRDVVKSVRDVARREISKLKEETRRHNDFDRRIPDVSKLRTIRPVIAPRGGDIKNIIQEGRKKAQHNKAYSPFMSRVEPIKHKYMSGYN